MTLTEFSDKLIGFAQSGHALSKMRLEDKFGKLHTIKDVKITEVDGTAVIKIIQGEEHGRS